MRDQEPTLPAPPDAPPQQMTLGGETDLPTSEPTAEELQAAELSRAARDAVRQPADPRIDRQLARMGLAEPDDGPRDDGGRVPARVVRAEDLARLEAEVAEAREAATDAQSGFARAERRLQLMTWAVTLEGIAIAILAVLLLVR